MKRWLACALATALLAAVAATAASAPRVHQGAQKATPAQLFKRMNATLDEAIREKLTGRPLREAVGKVERLKHELIDDHLNDTVFGGCPFRVAYVDIGEVDRFIELAAADDLMARTGGLTSHDRRRHESRYEAALDLAANRAAKLEGKLRDTCKADAGALEAARRLEAVARHAQEDLPHGGKLEKVADQARARKRQILAGQTLYDCAADRFFFLLEDIDLELGRAYFLDGGYEQSASKRLAQLRERALRAARRSKEALEEHFRTIPCGGVVPPPGSFAVDDQLTWLHPNGFGNPPSYECNKLSTEPPQSDATVVDVVTGPDGTEVTLNTVTDDLGEVVISQAITQTGTYKHVTTVTATDGTTASDTESQTGGLGDERPERCLSAAGLRPPAYAGEAAPTSALSRSTVCSRCSRSRCTGEQIRRSTPAAASLSIRPATSSSLPTSAVASTSSSGIAL